MLNVEIDEVAIGLNNGTVRIPGSRNTFTDSTSDSSSFVSINANVAAGLASSGVVYSIDSIGDGSKFQLLRRSSGKNTIVSKVALDYETRWPNGQASDQLPYSIIVTATTTITLTGKVASVSCPVYIKTVDVNESPVVAGALGSAIAVTEGTFAGTNIGMALSDSSLALVTDPDFGSSFTWTVDPVTSYYITDAKVKVTGSQASAYWETLCGGQLRVKKDIPLVITGGTTPKQFVLNMIVTDSGLFYAPLTAANKVAVTVNVVHVNHVPVLPLPATVTLKAAENSKLSPGTITATDIDGDIVTYGMKSSTLDTWDINPSTGVINLKVVNGVTKTMDWVLNNQFTLEITATDNGVPPLMTTQIYSFTIDHVNLPPVWLQSTIGYIPENSVANTKVNGQFVKTPEDKILSPVPAVAAPISKSSKIPVVMLAPPPVTRFNTPEVCPVAD